MASYLIPPVYAAFVWWFSTGAVLLLVGRSGRFTTLRAASMVALLMAGLAGLAMSADNTSVTGAYIAFTATILLWGAQEIAFLAGWITGPRPLACPEGIARGRRLSLALQAILYHELALVLCGAAVVALTWGAPNQIGLWTFAALWVLRQSAKINLFLGVPVTNDELMPDAVQFLKSFFAKKPVSLFFPVSVTLATAVLVVLIQRLVEVTTTPFEIAGLTLVSTLFALGVVEHWFMLLPLPAITLWGWGMRLGTSSEGHIMEIEPVVASSVVQRLETTPGDKSTAAQVVVLSSVRADAAPKSSRQRLEDQFRQQFLEEVGRNEMAAARRSVVEPAVNGRTS